MYPEGNLSALCSLYEWQGLIVTLDFPSPYSYAGNTRNRKRVEEALKMDLKELRTWMDPVLTAWSKQIRYLPQRFFTCSMLFGAITGLNIDIASICSGRKIDSAYHKVL